ncbi:MAG: FAD-binding oxidoreductase [Myxococcales bacterium]|nr:FAD-binding oxidoreductase [Myxococcales bacterium]MCB9627711.1 FAD-binding oxidoreductase [Sandaracinaceae bacterium]
MATKSRRARILRAALLVAATLVLAPLLRAGWHLGRVAQSDGESLSRAPVSDGAVVTDFGGHDQATPARVVRLRPPVDAAIELLRQALSDPTTAGLPVSVGGARHSSGGQTLTRGGVFVDASAFTCVRYDPRTTLVTVCGGTRWADVVPVLHAHGRSVAVMQSNDDFTVGGSLSVNAHGWQLGRGPVGSTVTALRVMLADGSVVTATPDDNALLFRHVIGGYGLFGVVLEATLETVPNARYRSHTVVVDADQVAREFAAARRSGAEFAYARLAMTDDELLRTALFTRFEPTGDAPSGPLEESRAGPLARAVFRGQSRSPYGRELRWTLERYFGGEAGGTRLRTSIQHESAEWFLNGRVGRVDVLHEYFVPPSRLGRFLGDVRSILRAQDADALNMTIRSVSADATSALPYAREDVLAVVMFFHDSLDADGDQRQQALSRSLTDAALAHGGTYYLPYRPHATPEQLRRSYPSFDAFVAAKRALDPTLRFRSVWFDRYAVEP